MAKQLGPYFITGSYYNLCFYEMRGRYFLRMKSSLSRKRVKSDPAFAKTMQYANLLGKAAKIASAVHRSLPKDKKEKGLYRKLTGMTMQWLKEGYDAEQVMIMLQEFVAPQPISKKEIATDKEPPANRYAFADAVIAGITIEPCEDEAIFMDSFCNVPP